MKNKICHWELELLFRSEEQVRTFIHNLTKEEVLFNFEYERTLEENTTNHYVRIEGNWASNLVRISELAEEVDQKMLGCME